MSKTLVKEQVNSFGFSPPPDLVDADVDVDADVSTASTQHVSKGTMYCGDCIDISQKYCDMTKRRVGALPRHGRVGVEVPWR